jgi:hypothetical protein
MARNTFIVSLLVAITFLTASLQAQFPKFKLPDLPKRIDQTANKPPNSGTAAPTKAKGLQTKIVVNVYKIGTAPFWHTGTVINDREYYFQTNNKVETCDPRGMGLKHHRTIVRHVPGDLKHVQAVLAKVKSRWNGTRYDLGKHNCDFFTDDLLRSLGSSGLDQEYLNASGGAKALRQIPGGATAQEAIVKIGNPKDIRMDEAAKEDLKRSGRLPDDTRKEAQKAGGKVANKAKKAGGSASKEAKKTRKKVLGF